MKAQAKGSSDDPLYTGDHLRGVADYLFKPLEASSHVAKYEPHTGTGSPFVWLYDLRSRRFPSVQRFDSVSKYESSLDNGNQPTYVTGLLFLTGNPTPEWLNAVGGGLNLDPVYLCEHLSFRGNVYLDTFAFPGIPSAGKNIRLTVPTIGQIEPKKSCFSSTKIQSLRRDCSVKLREKLRGFESKGQAGTSLVRRFFLHDTNRFTLEQDITISLVKENCRWTRRSWPSVSGGD